MGNWTPSDSEKLYGIKDWGMNHFSVSPSGKLRVHPLADNRSIDLIDVVKEAKSMGLSAPLTIRIQDLLRSRVARLNLAFAKAIDEEKYDGKYRGVFPIKTNQMREVVEEILDAGAEFNYGIEAGSKGELMVALALHDNNKSLLICNGYKDDDYIKLALSGTKIGKPVFLVVEQLSEIDKIIKLAKKEWVEPNIGIRVKLNISGEGRWAASVGENSKFGLFPTEILEALSKLKRAGLKKSLKLIHFHIGSQVPNIATVRNAVSEGARYYCELKRMGFGVEYIDCGGGLGIDYDGSRSNYESSTNYSLEEYARTVVYGIKSVCDKDNQEHPTIITESGRAIVAPHSILVLEVRDSIEKNPNEKPSPVKKNSNQVLKDLLHILDKKDSYKSNLERFLDAEQLKEEAHTLFSHGYLKLEEWAQAEDIFWRICKDVSQSVKNDSQIPEDLEKIDEILSSQYVCNFSVFQSLLDHWALKQVFPIVPLERLDEEPTVNTTIVDITCDSDGKINKFTDVEDDRDTLPLHRLKKNQPYYVAVCLVGAYQDILGDQHNLFGRVNEVHVFLEDDEEDGFYVEEAIEGINIDEILPQIQYKGEYVSRLMKKQIDAAVKADKIKPREGVRLLAQYNEALKSKTYLS
jgi:arginine 2-monooxygenase